MCGRGRGVGRAVPGLRVWAKQHYGRAASCWGSGGGAEVNQASEGGRAQTWDAARGWGVLADICSFGPSRGRPQVRFLPPSSVHSGHWFLVSTQPLSCEDSSSCHKDGFWSGQVTHRSPSDSGNVHIGTRGPRRALGPPPVTLRGCGWSCCLCVTASGIFQTH